MQSVTGPSLGRHGWAFRKRQENLHGGFARAWPHNGARRVLEGGYGPGERPVPCQNSHDASDLVFSELVRPLSDTR